MSSSWKFYVSYGLFDKDLCDVIAKWIADGRAKNKRSDTEVWGEYGGERLFAVDGGYVATVQVPFMKSFPYDLFGAAWLDREYDPYSRASYGNCEHAFDDTQLHRGKYMVAALKSFFEEELSETAQNLLWQKVEVAYLRGETRCRSFVSDYASDQEYRQKEAHEEYYVRDGVLEGWYPMPHKHEVIVPEGVHTIGRDAFSNTVDRVFFMNGYDLQSGKSTGEWVYPTYLRNVILPRGLKTIGQKAFFKVMTLKEMSLPDGLCTIGNQAFRECRGLTHVIIPDSVTHLGEEAFQGCKNLEGVTLSANLRTIPKQAFRDCPKLKYVVIPEGVKNIQSGAFQGCEILTITYAGQQPTCASDAFKGCVAMLGDNVSEQEYAAAWKGLSAEGKLTIGVEHLLSGRTLRECEMTFLVRAIRDVVTKAIELDSADVLETVFALKEKMPSLSQLDQWIADSEQAPTVKAFLTDCKSKHYTVKETAKAKTKMSEKQAGARVRTVADWKNIFEWRKEYGDVLITGVKTKEAQVEVPSVIGKTKVMGIGGAFRGCQTVESVVVAEGVPWIGYEAFANCTALNTVVLSQGVEHIATRAFAGCRNLASITFPESLSRIGENAFEDTPWLEAQSPLVIVNGIACGYRGQDPVLDIPEGVTTIGEKVFMGCEHLTAVTIPQSVTAIQRSAFKDCVNLASITIPEGVKHIEAGAFENTAWLAAQPSLVIINDSVYRYQGCEKEVSVPKGVKAIGIAAFKECQSLTRVVLPQGLEEIGNAAFFNCQNLTYMFIPESVTAIDKACGFSWCDKLTIHGKAGSYAQAYAEENGIPFKAG